MARSGSAVAQRLEERGDEVVAVDRTLGNEDDTTLLDGVDVVVKSARRAGRRAAHRARRGRGGCRCGRRSSSGGGCFRAARGSSGSPARTGRRRRRSFSARSSGPTAATWPSPATSASRSSSVREADWVVCELSSFQLEDVRDARLRRGGAAEPRARPSRPPRHVRGVPRREAADLRACARRASSRGSCLVASYPGIEFSAGRPAAGGAADPGRAQPRECGRGDRGGARGRGSATTAIAEALRDVRRRPAPARGRRRGRRRAVRQRLEGDERRRSATRARRIRGRAGAPDPRRVTQGRELRAARRRDRAERAARSTWSARPPPSSPTRSAGGRSATTGRSRRAVAQAPRGARPGDVVLLSPACASYDQYENFEHRGDHFRALVSALAP